MFVKIRTENIKKILFTHAAGQFRFYYFCQIKSGKGIFNLVAHSPKFRHNKIYVTNNLEGSSKPICNLLPTQPLNAGHIASASEHTVMT